MRLVEYGACMEVRGSDHKPVAAMFELSIKEKVAEGAQAVVADVLRQFGLEEVGVEVKSDGAAVAAAGVGMEFVPSEKKAEEEEKKEATEEEKVEKTAGDDDMDDLC